MSIFRAKFWPSTIKALRLTEILLKNNTRRKYLDTASEMLQPTNWARLFQFRCHPLHRDRFILQPQSVLSPEDIFDQLHSSKLKSDEPCLNALTLETVTTKTKNEWKMKLGLKRILVKRKRTM